MIYMCKFHSTQQFWLVDKILGAFIKTGNCSCTWLWCCGGWTRDFLQSAAGNFNCIRNSLYFKIKLCTWKSGLCQYPVFSSDRMSQYLLKSSVAHIEWLFTQRTKSFWITLICFTTLSNMKSLFILFLQSFFTKFGFSVRHNLHQWFTLLKI
jgi:hypothetical protein